MSMGNFFPLTMYFLFNLITIFEPENELANKYVSFVDTSTKQNAYFQKNVVSFVIFASLFSFYLLFKCLSEKHVCFRSNFQNR